MLTALKMPGTDGMDVLRRAHTIDPALPVIMITAFQTVESAVARPWSPDSNSFSTRPVL